MKTRINLIAILALFFLSTSYASMRTFTNINNSGKELVIEGAVYCTVGDGVSGPKLVPDFESYTIDKSPPGLKEIINFPYNNPDFPDQGTCDTGYKSGVSIEMAFQDNNKTNACQINGYQFLTTDNFTLLVTEGENGFPECQVVEQ